MEKKFLTKTFAFVLSILFFLTNCAFAHVVETSIWEQRRHSREGGNPGIKPDIKFQSKDWIPAFAGMTKFGSVRKTLRPDGKSKGTVLHIQDIHLNAEAQTNIARAIQSLIADKKVGLIALEGAFAPIDLAAFQNYPHRDTVRAVADYLLKENKISGPINALLTNSGAAVVGIDDETHYQANVAAYKAAALHAKSEHEHLALLMKTLSIEKSKEFNPALQQFDERIQTFRSGQMKMGDYVLLLAAHEPSRPSTVSAYLEALDLERQMDFARVEAERGQILSMLLAKLNPEKTKELIEASAASRTGNLSSADFYGYLKGLCEKNGVPLQRYPAMNNYLRYSFLSDQIDSEKLFAELKTMEENITATLAKRPKEKELVAASRRLYLMGKLLDFALSKEEWQEFKNTAKLFVLRSTLPESLRTNNFADFISFYSEAEIRDGKMAENFLRQISDHKSQTLNSKQDMTVLVTGGFHAHGIDQRLADAGYNVIQFVPKITKVDTDNGSAYLSVFAQEKTPLEKLFEGEKLFLSPLQTENIPLAAAGVAGIEGANAFHDVLPNTDAQVQVTTEEKNETHQAHVRIEDEKGKTATIDEIWERSDGNPAVLKLAESAGLRPWRIDPLPDIRHIDHIVRIDLPAVRMIYDEMKLFVKKHSLICDVFFTGCYLIFILSRFETPKKNMQVLKFFALKEVGYKEFFMGPVGLLLDRLGGLFAATQPVHFSNGKIEPASFGLEGHPRFLLQQFVEGPAIVEQLTSAVNSAERTKGILEDMLRFLAKTIKRGVLDMDTRGLTGNLRGEPFVGFDASHLAPVNAEKLQIILDGYQRSFHVLVNKLRLNSGTEYQSFQLMTKFALNEELQKRLRSSKTEAPIQMVPWTSWLFDPAASLSLIPDNKTYTRLIAWTESVWFIGFILFVVLYLAGTHDWITIAIAGAVLAPVYVGSHYISDALALKLRGLKPPKRDFWGIMNGAVFMHVGGMISAMLLTLSFPGLDPLVIYVTTHTILHLIWDNLAWKNIIPREWALSMDLSNKGDDDLLAQYFLDASAYQPLSAEEEQILTNKIDQLRKDLSPALLNTKKAKDHIINLLKTGDKFRSRPPIIDQGQTDDSPVTHRLRAENRPLLKEMISTLSKARQSHFWSDILDWNIHHPKFSLNERKLFFICWKNIALWYSPVTLDRVKVLRREIENARDEMVRRNLRLVMSIAMKYRNRGLSLLDLIQEGNLALIRTTYLFNPELGNKFSTYVTRPIKWEIKHALKVFKRSVPTISLNEKIKTSTGEIDAQNIADPKGQSLEKHIENSDLAAFILSQLPVEERIVFEVWSGIKTGQPLKWVEVGNLLGLSKQRMDQIKSKVAALMKKFTGGAGSFLPDNPGYTRSLAWGESVLIVGIILLVVLNIIGTHDWITIAIAGAVLAPLFVQMHFWADRAAEKWYGIARPARDRGGMLLGILLMHAVGTIATITLPSQIYFLDPWILYVIAHSLFHYEWNKAVSNRWALSLRLPAGQKNQAIKIDNDRWELLSVLFATKESKIKLLSLLQADLILDRGPEFIRMPDEDKNRLTVVDRIRLSKLTNRLFEGEPSALALVIRQWNQQYPNLVLNDRKLAKLFFSNRKTLGLSALQLKEVDRLKIQLDRSKNELVMQNRPLVGHIAKDFRARALATGMEFSTLLSAGDMGLINAVEGFREEMGGQLSTYAVYAIKRMILREFELKGDPSDLSKGAVSLSQTFKNSEDDNALSAFTEDPRKAPTDQFENSDFVARLLRDLSEREKDVLTLRYASPPETLEDVGNKFRITKERVRQIQAQALKKLKREAKKLLPSSNGTNALFPDLRGYTKFGAWTESWWLFGTATWVALQLSAWVTANYSLPSVLSTHQLFLVGAALAPILVALHFLSDRLREKYFLVARPDRSFAGMSFVALNAHFWASIAAHTFPIYAPLVDYLIFHSLIHFLANILLSLNRELSRSILSLRADREPDDDTLLALLSSAHDQLLEDNWNYLAKVAPEILRREEDPISWKVGEEIEFPNFPFRYSAPSTVRISRSFLQAIWAPHKIAAMEKTNWFDQVALVIERQHINPKADYSLHHDFMKLLNAWRKSTGRTTPEIETINIDPAQAGLSLPSKLADDIARTNDELMYIVNLLAHEIETDIALGDGIGIISVNYEGAAAAHVQVAGGKIVDEESLGFKAYRFIGEMGERSVRVKRVGKEIRVERIQEPKSTNSLAPENESYTNWLAWTESFWLIGPLTWIVLAIATDSFVFNLPSEFFSSQIFFLIGTSLAVVFVALHLVIDAARARYLKVPAPKRSKVIMALGASIMNVVGMCVAAQVPYEFAFPGYLAGHALFHFWWNVVFEDWALSIGQTPRRRKSKAFEPVNGFHEEVADDEMAPRREEPDNGTSIVSYVMREAKKHPLLTKIQEVARFMEIEQRRREMAKIFFAKREARHLLIKLLHTELTTNNPPSIVIQKRPKIVLSKNKRKPFEKKTNVKRKGAEKLKPVNRPIIGKMIMKLLTEPPRDLLAFIDAENEKHPKLLVNELRLTLKCWKEFISPDTTWNWSEREKKLVPPLHDFYFKEVLSMALHNLGLLVTVATKKKNQFVTTEDLIQDLYAGLIASIEGFYYPFGFKFSTYAMNSLLQRAIRPLELDQKIRNSTISIFNSIDATGMTHAENFVSKEVPPELQSEKAETWQMVETILNQIGGREQKILAARFGLDGNGPKSLREVGESLNLTRERTRQLEEKAMTEALNKLLGKAIDYRVSNFFLRENLKPAELTPNQIEALVEKLKQPLTLLEKSISNEQSVDIIEEINELRLHPIEANELANKKLVIFANEDNIRRLTPFIGRHPETKIDLIVAGDPLNKFSNLAARFTKGQVNIRIVPEFFSRNDRLDPLKFEQVLGGWTKAVIDDSIVVVPRGFIAELASMPGVHAESLYRVAYMPMEVLLDKNSTFATRDLGLAMKIIRLIRSGA